MPAVTVNRRHQAGGFSLLEVLITMLVVALALLGHITLQNRTISEQQAAFFQGMADTYLNDIAERMAANAEEATMAVTRDPATNTASVANAATSYNNSNNNVFRSIDPAATPAPSTDCSGASSCNRAQLAAYDLAIWQRNVGAVMPGAAFRIRNVGGADQPSLVEITLAWAPNKDGESVTAAGCGVANSNISVQCRVLVKML